VEFGQIVSFIHQAKKSDGIGTFNVINKLITGNLFKVYFAVIMIFSFLTQVVTSKLSWT